MAAPLYKTLGELRQQLRTRLGFAAAGAAAGVIQANLDSILQEAQVLLYWTHDWARLRKYWDTTVGLNQYLIDYPDGCNPERIKAISVNRNDVWSPPLKKGISPQMYTTQDNTRDPYAWEPYEQIELYPKADQQYDVRIFGVRTLGRFTDTNDRSTIDDSMVFTVALGRAKAHYRHPDAGAYGEDANALLIRLKGKNWGKDVFNPNDFSACEPLARPVVV
jgi:hypothetical protein